MYTVSRSGASFKLTADAALTSSDFDAIALQLITHGVNRFRASKVGYVSAFQITSLSVLQGVGVGRLGSIGDWLVTNLSKDRKVIHKVDGLDNYVVRKDKFASLYQRDTGATEFGDIYASISAVDALELSGGLDIVASWGDRQQMTAGFLLRKGGEVYGADSQTFSDTYQYNGDTTSRA